MRRKPVDVCLHKLKTVNNLENGSLTVAEFEKDIPFKVERVFYIYDLPVGAFRARHAHRHQEEFLICQSGKVEVTTVRCSRERQFVMSRPDKGIYLPPMTWISVRVLNPGTMCLVICSGAYDENDYIREYEDFQAMQKT